VFFVGYACSMTGMGMRRGHAVALAISFGFQAAMFAAIGAISSNLSSNTSTTSTSISLTEAPNVVRGGTAAVDDVLVDVTLTAVTADLTVGWAVPDLAPGTQGLLYRPAGATDAAADGPDPDPELADPDLADLELADLELAGGDD
jgi:hypothetical protein